MSDVTLEQALRDHAAAVARQKETRELKKEADRNASSADVAVANAVIAVARLLEREMPEVVRELRRTNVSME